MIRVSEFQRAMALIASVGFAGLLVSCSTAPMVSITEEEHLGLQRQVRVLSRELEESRKDYEQERGENLKVREQIRKMEHPMTLREEACSAPSEYEYYGSTFSEELQRHFNLYTRGAGK
jgi:hypothetical protein